MNYYNSIAKGYNELHQEEQLKKCKLIAEHIDFQNKKILDVGCGTGIATSFFNCETGIDPSEELIKIAKEKHPKIKFIVGKAEELPFESNSFDIVISITAIQNFEDIPKALDEIRRVGKEFVLTFLKKANKRDLIEKEIQKRFRIKEKLEEEKDIIYILSK